MTCQDHTASFIRELNVGLSGPWPALAVWCVNVENQDAPEVAS